MIKNYYLVSGNLKVTNLNNGRFKLLKRSIFEFILDIGLF